MSMQMSEQARKKLNEFNEAQADWFTQCPVCHAELKGTLAELRGHKCLIDTHI